MKHKGGLGWLRSEKQYSDFVLRLEFRFLECQAGRRRFCAIKQAGDNWPDRKYEVQIENTERMAKIFGANHDLNVELAQKVLKPTGEWNEYEIKLIGSKIEVRLNGELVSKSDKMKRAHARLHRPAGRERRPRVPEFPDQGSEQVAIAVANTRPTDSSDHMELTMERPLPRRLGEDGRRSEANTMAADSANSVLAIDT